ncbi:unnamed protein product [Phaedon cochleariae]|uniref:Uncharacterized protein n=1 Tax=Phaedon cochleariae TaxID=80249 RepID=A0A9N9SER9_PHACE|nr:unnamed protein product [Phaedon cochleariae]
MDKSDYMPQNVTAFKEKLNDITLDINYTLVSFDVNALISSIPFLVLQKEDSGNANHVEDDDDDDEEDNLFSAKNGVEKNIFSSATDAVISMVKRAAQVLGNKVDNQTTNTNKSLSNALVNTCSCPRHLIICNNCTETLLGQIYELLSCKSDTIRKLIGLPPIYRALAGSASCSKFGYRNSNGRDDSRLEGFFPEKYVGAMCNEMAISEQQGVLNVSQHFPNITSDLTNDKIISMDVKEVVDLQGKPNETVIDVTEQPGNTTIHSATVDTSQIKPTKTLTVDPNTTTTPVPEDLVPANPETAPPNPETAPFFDADPTPDVDLSNETMETALDEQMESVDSSTVVVTASPQAPKESIFLRLSNRIKALERNVSLSSQYLEELSKRYKKQVEEMQNLSEKTIAVLREESQERLESKQKLEERLDQLAAAVDTLVAERRSFFLLVYFFLFVGIVGSVYYFFCGSTEGAVQISRRLSDEDTLRRPKERKKRRPSDQVLKIVRYSSVNEDERSRRSKKRKKKVSKRSHSAGSLKLKNDDDWVTGTQQVIEDHAPFVLDESDHVISEPLNLPEQEEQEEDRDSAQRVQIVIEENRHEGVETNSTCRSPSNGVEGVKKEKRGLKRFLKKVF